MNGAPEGSLGLVYESGWMTSGNFVKVLEHVVKFTGSSTENPIILIMDNHESHIALDSIIFAKDHGINIVTLPPHASNKTQPLDLSVFGPHKSCFNSAANAWMLSHPGKTITIYQMAQLMGDAWMKAASPTNITAGFRMYGIWPLDRNVFSSESYLPSSVTDRPLQNQQQSDERSTSAPSTPTAAASDQDNSYAAGQQSGLSQPSDEQQTPTPTETPEPASSRSNSSFVSPQQFRGYPKVTFLKFSI
jgi:hypothetical protein